MGIPDTTCVLEADELRRMVATSEMAAPTAPRTAHARFHS